jgi:hypothetical protein
MTGKEPMDETSPSTPPDDNECVSHMELKDMMLAMTDAFNKYQSTTTNTFQRIHTSVDGLAARLDAVEARFPHHAPPPIVPAAGGLAHNDTEDESTMMRLMHSSAVAFYIIVKVWEVMVDVVLMLLSKIMILTLRLSFLKFSIPPFYGSYDAETYLDWEMMVEQKFSSHLVSEHHRVRQATSEFKDFAIIWWNELVNAHNAP